MLSADQQRRIARNEAAFRALNETLRQRRAQDSSTLSVVCECGLENCQRMLRVDAARYREVRQQPDRFIVTSGHELPGAEQVIDRAGELLIVEKLPGPGRQAAVELDPRS